MTLRSIILRVSGLAIGLATCLIGGLRGDDRKPSILRQQYQGLQLEFFNNSATASQALGINLSGAIIGMREDDTQRQVYFYCGEKGCQDMPIPKGFTNVEAAAISDTDIVVGRATKPLGSEGSIQAVVWSPSQSAIKLLPVPADDKGADAFDIAADGKRITGYATGSKRFRPVVWDWNENQSSWQVEVLPTAHEYNPYLMSSQLVVSPDGNTIVGCCTENFLENGTIDSSLYAWRKVEGKWVQRRITQEQLYVKAVNNKGQIAGSIAGEQGRLPCVVTSEGSLKLLDLLERDVAGEARDINEDSMIVGWSDDPPGPDGSPVPCTWTLEGKATQLRVNELEFGMLYAISNTGQIAGAAGARTETAAADDANDAEAALLAVRISKAK